MWEFRSKNSKRQHHIFNEHFIFNKELTLQELSNDLQCSRSTIINTINDINRLDVFSKLFFDDRTQVLKSTHLQGTYENVFISSFFNNTLELQILEYIFLHGPVSEEHIIRDLYISHSTLQRNLIHLKNNLDKYNLDISGTPYTITGNELLLRNFFLQYYREKNDCAMFKDYAEFQQTSFQLFKNIIAHEEYSHMTPAFNYFHWVVFITSIRLSQGHTIEDSLETTIRFDTVINNALTKQIKYQLVAIFGLYNLSDTAINDYLYFFNPSNHSKNLNNKNNEEIKKVYLEILNIFDIQIDEISFNHISTTLNEYFLGYYGDIYFLFDTSYYQYSLIKHDFPKSVTKLYEIVKQVFERVYPSNNKFIYNFILLIIRYTPDIYNSFIKYESKISVNVLLLAEESKVNHIYKFLSNSFINIANFNLVNSKHFVTKREFNKGIWITNVSTINNRNILQIDVNLIYSSHMYISSFLEQYKDRKLDEAAICIEQFGK